MIRTKTLNGYMVDLFMGQLWAQSSLKGRVGDQVGGITGGRLCQGSYFILSMKGNLMGKGLEEESYNCLIYSKDNLSC